MMEQSSYEKSIIIAYKDSTTDQVLQMLETTKSYLEQASENYRNTKLSKFDDDIHCYTRSMEVMRFVLAERGYEKNDRQN